MGADAGREDSHLHAPGHRILKVHEVRRFCGLVGFCMGSYCTVAVPGSHLEDFFGSPQAQSHTAK